VIEVFRYTSRCFRKLLAAYGLRASMGDVGMCYDNAVVEWFFGRLKHDWILKVYQSTREVMKQDVTNYIKYYNLDRLHSANDSLSLVNFENSQLKVSCLDRPEHVSGGRRIENIDPHVMRVLMAIIGLEISENYRMWWSMPVWWGRAVICI